jgi:hypothetical protein
MGCNKNDMGGGFCVAHGGGTRCPCGRLARQCPKCLTLAQQQRSGIFCLLCGDKQLGLKRMLRTGGNGICAECDPKVPPRTEIRLRPKILAGIHQPPEALDSALFGRDCDVDRNRRPDKLFVVRAADDGRILGIIKVGIDEDSHNNVPPGKTREEHIQCELGKVGNQFDALVMLVHIEDVLRYEDSKQTITHRMLTMKALEARGEISEKIGLRGIPMFFVKWNPDAYDKARVSVEERIRVLQAYVNATCDAIRDGKLGEDFDLSRPHVKFMYYHSKADDIVQAFVDNPLVVVESEEDEESDEEDEEAEAAAAAAEAGSCSSDV